MSFDLKRIFIIFGLIFTLLFSFGLARPTPAYAIDWVGGWNRLKSWADGFWTAVSCATDVHCWIQQVSPSIASHGIDVITGTNIEKLRLASSLDDAFANGYGLIGGTGMLIEGAYSNPADIHFATFFKDKLADNLLISPAYATAGTDILSPIYGAWEKVRNIAYALFVVVVGAIALMIILQKQIATRVVVTVTHAIPKIFLSLILITLSYPIAALFIDIFAVWLPAVLNQLFGFENMLDAMMQGLGGIGEAALTQSLGGIFTGSAVAILLAIVLAAAAYGAGLTVLFLILIIAFVALIVLGFIFLQLLYRYTRLMIFTVLGPLIVLLGSLPGQEDVTTNWFKSLGADALAFPVILFAFYLSVTILQAGTEVTTSAEALRGIPGLGPAGVLVGHLIVPLSSLMVLLAAFKAPGMIERLIKGGKKGGKP